MWTNRLRKSRHDRVTAGSQQSIKTQGDCLHLKDTKYHYNKHERAHPSHCRLLFCQHCFALQGHAQLSESLLSYPPRQASSSSSKQQQAAGKKQASSKQAASKLQASQPASKPASKQQAAASSSKQQQAAASSSKQQQAAATASSRQAAASKQQPAFAPLKE